MVIQAVYARKHPFVRGGKTSLDSGRRVITPTILRRMAARTMGQEVISIMRSPPKAGWAGRATVGIDIASRAILACEETSLIKAHVETEAMGRLVSQCRGKVPGFTPTR